MVKGLQRFVEHFRGFEDSYVLIGGAACELWLADRALPFRATKDLDIVLIVEALRREFIQRFWAFIREGRYKHHDRSANRPEFYRFKEPAIADYPFMIELLSRNYLDLPGDIHLTPIPADEDISSLSAILLDTVYYAFVMETRLQLSGVPIVPAQCLIPLKARAWLDLTARKAAGDLNVKTDDIKKHRNDVFRLYRSLAPAEHFTLPSQLRADLGEFLHRHPHDSPDWAAIRQAVGAPAMPDAATVIAQLQDIFGLVQEATS